MIELGNTLRAAREAKGYTASQVAEMTRLTVQVIEALEAEDFKTIVAPIYGRGFVKLYCEAVGIEDVKSMTDTFTALYNHSREQRAQEPVRPERRAPKSADLGDLLPGLTPDAAPAKTAVPPAAPANPTPARAAVPPAARANPAPTARATTRPVKPPTVPFWQKLPLRLILVGAVVLLILVVFVYSIVAAVKACRSVGGDSAEIAEKAPVQQEARATPAAAEEDAAKPPRTPQKIPDLYID